jgi:hypothetical protein
VQHHNALVAATMDVDRFWDTVIAAWARIPAAGEEPAAP